LHNERADHERIDPMKKRYHKPRLTKLGLLRTMTRFSF
jgi:hypothetical protein